MGEERDTGSGARGGRTEIKNSQIQLGQIDSHPSDNAVPSTLVVLSLGVAHRMHQGHVYDRDGTSHPPHSAVAATILPYR